MESGRFQSTPRFYARYGVRGLQVLSIERAQARLEGPPRRQLPTQADPWDTVGRCSNSPSSPSPCSTWASPVTALPPSPQDQGSVPTSQSHRPGHIHAKDFKNCHSHQKAWDMPPVVCVGAGVAIPKNESQVKNGVRNGTSRTSGGECQPSKLTSPSHCDVGFKKV